MKLRMRDRRACYFADCAPALPCVGARRPRPGQPPITGRSRLQEWTYPAAVPRTHEASRPLVYAIFGWCMLLLVYAFAGVVGP
jgi:hypothetical protein